MTADTPSACPEFSQYMAEFRARLRQALRENKWYLSERVGRDVGEEAALDDFLKNHFDRFAEEVRSRFCRETCGRHADCPLARYVRALPPTAKTLELHSVRAPRAADPEPAHHG